MIQYVIKLINIIFNTYTFLLRGNWNTLWLSNKKLLPDWLFDSFLGNNQCISWATHFQIILNAHGWYCGTHVWFETPVTSTLGIKKTNEHERSQTAQIGCRHLHPIQKRRPWLVVLVEHSIYFQPKDGTSRSQKEWETSYRVKGHLP